jgi:signal transduction histidine kinase
MVSAPLFYYFTEKLYADEINDTLILHKNEFLQYVIPTLKTTDIDNWNKYNRDIKIKPSENRVRDTILQTTYYDTLDNELEPYRELHSPILIEGKNYAYVAKINMIETKDLLQSIVLLFIIVILILLVGLYFTTKVLSRKLWKPFNDTLNQIEHFEIDKNKKPFFLKTDIEEFNRLNSSIEKLIEKNSIIYKNQREFIENAAHELQTPLAVFQAKIDTLIQLPNITQEQSEILSSLNDNVSKLNHLNKNLLLLSKIEDNTYYKKEIIIVNDIIQKNLVFFTEQASAKNISIKTTLENEIKIESNSTLVEILINNLLLNSIRHNITDGQILITISENMLTVSNTGQVQSLDTNKLFIRFSRSTSSEQGNGLGLAIIKKITDLNQWRIDYSFQNDLHNFQVRF